MSRADRARAPAASPPSLHPPLLWRENVLCQLVVNERRVRIELEAAANLPLGGIPLIPVARQNAAAQRVRLGRARVELERLVHFSARLGRQFGRRTESVNVRLNVNARQEQVRP